jgi:hypothetical protein
MGNGSFRLSFTNASGASFSALASTKLALPASNWPVIGPATQTAPAQFQFTGPGGTNFPARFYRIRSP